MTESGSDFLRRFGAQLVAPPRSRRIFCRPCLDWSERRYHIAGRVGAEICRCCLERGWFVRERDSRALRLTPAGRTGLTATFGLKFPVGPAPPGELRWSQQQLSPPGEGPELVIASEAKQSSP